VKEKKLQHYYIGDLSSDGQELQEESKRCIEDWYSIVETLKGEGLFDTDYWWYVKYACWVSVIFSLVLYGVFRTNSLLWTVSAAVFLGCFWHQLALLGHDLCHNAVTHDRDKDLFIAVLASGFLGISAQWWKRSHNIHHIATNAVEYDPDIQHLPILAITEKLFHNIYSHYHERILYFDAVSQWLVSHQHWFYYPTMAVSRWNLYIQSWILLIKAKEKLQFRILDCISLALFWTWYLLLLWNLGSWHRALLFVAISHAVAGVLHVQITLSHFAMPSYEGKPHSGDDDGLAFLRTQLNHSLDINCPWYMDLFHGGLQFQVAHHLLPRVPRHHLREVTFDHLIPFCKRWNLTYHSCTFIEANQCVWQILSNVATSARNWKGKEG
jgi:delta8-fatty-acid desaturase